MSIGQGPSISELVAKTVLNTKFKTEITDILSIPLLQENSEAVPPAPDKTNEFIRFVIDMIPGATKNARGVYEKLGIATAQIFTPLGTGYGRPTEISTMIVNAFQDAQWTDQVMIITDVSSDPGHPSGSFYQTNVLISFQYLNNGTD